MNTNKDNSDDIATGLVLVPTIIFIALKISKTIYWSWIWVFSPVWIPLAFFGFFVMVGLIFEYITRRK
ncbi:hypothetical protein [Flavobacterium fluviatile]|uniref:hypothetical protein n=1 Tax=Flavobacterium fluviatile TaxID=1862387 RepID=UPI0013D4C54C|nr:hypothetical protein [Flavobacterium fluviatile]